MRLHRGGLLPEHAVERALDASIAAGECAQQRAPLGRQRTGQRSAGIANPSCQLLSRTHRPVAKSRASRTSSPPPSPGTRQAGRQLWRGSCWKSHMTTLSKEAYSLDDKGIPTMEGARRYPLTGGYYVAAPSGTAAQPETHACTCVACCDETCHGECDCVACGTRWSQLRPPGEARRGRF